MFRYKSYSKHVLIGFLLALIVMVSFWYGYQNNPQQTLNIDQINANSVLRKKSFDKKPVKISTESGLTAWLIEENSIPIVSISFLFRKAGKAYDPEGKFGLSDLSAHMITKGAGGYTREAFQEELELNGINLSFGSSQENFMGALTTPKQNAGIAYKLLRLALTEPLFQQSELDVIKNQALQALKIQREEPQASLGLVFNNIVFGNHPYGRNPLGEKKDILSISPEDLKNFVRKNLAKENLLIGIAGDISATEAKEILEKIFSGLPLASQTTELQAPIMNLKPGHHYVKEDLTQIVSRFAVKGVRRNDNDFYPLYVANYIFGGAGLTSRLSLQAREKENLTYGIYTFLSDNEKAPLIIGQFNTSTQNYPKMIEILGNEWKKFASKGATKEEVEAAKNYLLASYNLRFNSVSGLAAMLLAMQENNLGLDFLQKRNEYIRAVTVEDVNKVAAKYFTDQPIEVHIGNLDEKE